MADSSAAGRMTVDELARCAGLTVRTVRHYQSRGLIPAPHLEGRVGYYGSEHLAGLQLIREMQARGFNLAAIGHLIGQERGGGERMLGFTRSLMAPFEEEVPLVLTRDEITARLGGTLPADHLERSQRLGLIRPLDDDHFEVLSPTLMSAGERLAAIGVPLEVTLDVTAELRHHSDEIARAFVQVFLQHLWEPFDRAGRPEHDWPRIQESLDQLRPLALETLMAIFRRSMTEAVESAFGEWVNREDEPKP